MWGWIGSLDRKLLRDLWRIKGQVMAIAAVLAGGVSLFVMMLGAIQSLEQSRETYYDRYRFAHVFSEARRAPLSAMSAIRSIPGIQTAESRIIVDVSLDIPLMSGPAVGRLISVPDEGEPALNRLVLRTGRMPEPGDDLEVVISEAFAEAHGLGPGDAIAAILNERRRALSVVGVVLSPEYVYSMGPGALFPDNRTFGVFWTTRPALAAAFDLDGAFNAVSATVLRGSNTASIIEEIDLILEPYGGLGAYDRSDQISAWFVANELQQLSATIRFVPPIFLIIAAFLLNIAIARLIETEREQIGLFKAFGYSDAAVGWHYAKLALGMAAVGVVIGCLLGAWMGRGMTALYAQYFRFPVLTFDPDPAVFVLAAAIGAIAALGGTWTAVRRAVRLPPAEAMRPPSPARFRRGAVDSSRWTRWLTQTDRIILRNIRRWPGRSVLTAAGTATAVAIMIGSMFSIGAIEHILDIQFSKAQRQDATIALVTERSESVVAEVRRLPGVLDAEPFHALPVRLIVGPVSERTTLMGLEPEPRLFTMLDLDLAPVPTPPSGLMLASAVADRLGLNKGDTVGVEVMTGRRESFDVTLTAITQEYIGGSVVMDRQDMGRHLADPGRVSGVHVIIDSDRLDDFNRMIKQTPAVAAVTYKSNMLESFRTHVADNMYQVIFMNSLFAGLIAFGVVYNSARIMLSERARELASLRVLGFTRFEITYILLGELALLTAVALPVGCLLGWGLAALMSSAFETDLYRIPLIIQPSTYGMGIGVVGAAAILSGAVVARRLSTLDLVAVLKSRD